MLKHYQVFLHLHTCASLSVGLESFFFPFSFFFLFFFYKKKKVVPTSDEVSFSCGSHREPSRVRVYDLTDY